MSGTLYLTLKTLHIIAIISWMAGVLYYFRLFVYHYDQIKAGKSEEIHQLLSLMERRLYRFITVPAMIVAVAAASGILVLMPELLSQKWFHVKLTAGIAMIGVTLYGNSLLKHFQRKEISHYSSFKLRLLNEVPTLLMILIVVMVIFRPI